MIVNLVSESTIFPKKLGGLHTAFLTYIQLLKKTHIHVAVNSFGKADITHIHSLGPYALYKLLTSKNTVITAHTLPETFIGNFKGGQLLQGVIKKYLHFFYNSAGVVISLTEAAKEE